MPHRSPTLPASGQWDTLTTWWLSRFAPTTQRNYRAFIRRWTSWCADRGVDPMAAGRADVELWLRALADSGLAPATVAVHFDAVGSIYKLAHDEDLVDRNPCARIDRPPVHRELQRREVLTVLEYAAYLTAARRLGPTEHAIAVLGGMMGLRASEMAGLRVESLSQVRGYWVLTFVGKGGRPARVPVPIPALAAIQAVVDGRTTGPLLRRIRSGGPLDRRAVHSYVVRTARAAGITRPIGPHALRRTAGTVGLAQGIPLREVQRLLRHFRSETTLQSYDLTGDALDTHASHQIAGFLAGWAD